MGFYYLNLLSLLFLAVVCGIAILLFWLFWTKGLSRNFRGPVVWLVIAAILVAPWIEEFWIAYHFGQACKEAGTFIYKKVAVDGFYDATMRSGYENTKPGRYRFVEHATEDRKGVERVERADDRSRAMAIAMHAERSSGKGLSNGRAIVYSPSDNEQIVVFPNGIDAWRVTKVDRPTARYHYKLLDPHGTLVGHKTVRTETVVVDTEANEEMARYTSFGRSPPWFWIGLDIPEFACDAPSRWPFTKGSGLIYREVLIPPVHR